MDFSIVILVASYAYFLSALVRFIISRNKPSPEEERRRRLERLYGKHWCD